MSFFFFSIRRQSDTFFFFFLTVIQARSFRGIQYSASVANFYTDTNLKPEASWHPKINDTVYYGQFSMCALEKALMRFTPIFKCFPNVAFETVPVLL